MTDYDATISGGVSDGLDYHSGEVDPLASDELESLNFWPVGSGSSEAASDPHQASPFSVAVATAAGMTGIRALRAAWQRRREAEALFHSGKEPVLAPSSGTGLDRVEEERSALVALCIELHDLLGQQALREKLRRGLRHVGVEALEPEGAAFDPELHRAVGTMAAPDPTQDRLVARVDRAGFRDRGVELRAPEVIVYRFESAGQDAADA